MVGHVSVTDGSDHEAVSLILKLASTRPNIPRRTLFNYKRADFAKLRETLSDIPWDICFLTNSVDDAWVKFKDLLLISADQWVPKLVLKNKKRSTWLAQETIAMIRHKDRAYLKAERTSKQLDWTRFKNLSNTVRDLTRKHHHDHLDTITSNLHTNPKPFWNWIIRIRNGISCIPDLSYQGLSLSKVADKANAFNYYFISVFTKEKMNQLNSLRNITSIEDVKFDEVEVYAALCRINPSKSCGPDNIPGKFLVESALAIHKPLTKIFNKNRRTPQRLDQSQCHTNPQKRPKTPAIEL